MIDNEIEFAEVPMQDVSIESSVPGGKYISQKTSGVFGRLKLYFNVTTEDVIERLIFSLNPNRREFLNDIEGNPDLYGPIWLTISVSFFAFMLGSISSWLKHGSQYTYNFQSFVTAGILLSILVFGSPFAIYFYKKAMAPSVLIMISFLGYSTSYLIPGCLLRLIFGSFLGTILCLAIGCAGTYSIYIKFDEYRKNNDRNIIDNDVGLFLAIPYLIVYFFVTRTCF